MCSYDFFLPRVIVASITGKIKYKTISDKNWNQNQYTRSRLQRVRLQRATGYSEQIYLRDKKVRLLVKKRDPAYVDKKNLQQSSPRPIV